MKKIFLQIYTDLNEGEIYTDLDEEEIYPDEKRKNPVQTGGEDTCDN